MTHRGFMNKRSNSVSRSDYVLVTRCRKEYEYHHILCKHNIWARLPYGVLTGHVNLLLALFMREAFGFGSPWQVLSRVGVRGSSFYKGAPVGLLFVRAMGSSIGFDILTTEHGWNRSPRPFGQIDFVRSHWSVPSSSRSSCSELIIMLMISLTCAFMITFLRTTK